MDKGTATNISNNIKKTNENFADLLEESFSKEAKKVGSLVKGEVVAIEKDSVVVDIGYKAEGRVPIKEFTPPDKKPELGDEVEVFFENAENKYGDAVLSRERAKRENERRSRKSARPVSAFTALASGFERETIQTTLKLKRITRTYVIAPFRVCFHRNFSTTPRTSKIESKYP